MVCAAGRAESGETLRELAPGRLVFADGPVLVDAFPPVQICLGRKIMSAPAAVQCASGRSENGKPRIFPGADAISRPEYQSAPEKT
jgi:hypothetical protein